MTVEAWKHEAAKQLKAGSVGTSWYLDARLLLQSVLALSQVQLILDANRQLSNPELEKLNALLQLRLKHKPMAYILGSKEFFGRDFHVNEHTLIPRSDTETIIEAVLSYAQGKQKEVLSPMIDVCCGSGAIGITLSLELSLPVTLSDISKDVLKVASDNAERLLKTDFTLLEGDLLTSSIEKYGIIVSNPPYLTPSWCEQVSEQVSWEPRLALDGFGDDGLDVIRRLVVQSTTRLKRGGALFLECDYRQAHDVAALLVAHQFTQVSIVKDLAGLDRVVWGVLYV